MVKKKKKKVQSYDLLEISCWARTTSSRLHLMILCVVAPCVTLVAAVKECIQFEVHKGQAACPHDKTTGDLLSFAKHTRWTGLEETQEFRHRAHCACGVLLASAQTARDERSQLGLNNSFNSNLTSRGPWKNNHTLNGNYCWLTHRRSVRLCIATPSLS